MRTDYKVAMTPETAVDQAVGMAARFMQGAIDEIDAVFGTGYAKEHPELVGDFMRTAVMDFHNTVTLIVAEAVDELVKTTEA